MYSINGNVVRIDGRHGKYDGKVKNVDVRYGRNANDNYKSYIKDIGNYSKNVPLEFEYKYMPNGEYNRFALIGSAYEEMGQRTKIKVADANKEFESQGMSEYSVNALDINRDGYIDISEYATSTLAQDILSSSDGYDLDPSKVNGVINNKGEQKAFALNNKYIESQAREAFARLHHDFGLAQTQDDFLADCNNLVK